MTSWGILGNPSQKQIDQWKNMPYGHFKTMVKELEKRSKGKSLRKHAVEIKRIDETFTRAFVYVQAFDMEHAIQQAKEIDCDNLDWSDSKIEPTKTSYRVCQVW